MASLGVSAMRRGASTQEAAQVCDQMVRDSARASVGAARCAQEGLAHLPLVLDQPSVRHRVRSSFVGPPLRAAI